MTLPGTGIQLVHASRGLTPEGVLAAVWLPAGEGGQEPGQRALEGLPQKFLALHPLTVCRDHLGQRAHFLGGVGQAVPAAAGVEKIHHLHHAAPPLPAGHSPEPGRGGVHPPHPPSFPAPADDLLQFPDLLGTEPGPAGEGGQEPGQRALEGLPQKFLATRDLHASDFPDNVPTEHEEMFASQGITTKFLIARPV